MAYKNCILKVQRIAYIKQIIDIFVEFMTEVLNKGSRV
jgi:hypothetical protein